MTQENPNVGTSAALQLALWTLFAGNFIIGTGILLPAGMLNDLSQGLAVSPPAIGLLMLAGGIVIVLAGPVSATLPGGLHAGKLSLNAWRDVFADPVLIMILLVTLASASGQFAVFSYLALLFKELLGASPALIAGLLAGFGAAGVAGNFLAARFVGR